VSASSGYPQHFVLSAAAQTPSLVALRDLSEETAYNFIDSAYEMMPGTIRNRSVSRVSSPAAVSRACAWPR
jgi:hypothetical protein